MRMTTKWGLAAGLPVLMALAVVLTACPNQTAENRGDTPAMQEKAGQPDPQQKTTEMTAKSTPVAEKAELNWLTDFTKAQETARSGDKYILADFTGSDWCVWCKRLDAEVFSQTVFRQFANDRFVPFMADFPNSKIQTQEIKEQNQALMDRYGVRGFPTILILDTQGKQLAQTGYRQGGAEAYVKHLKELIAQIEKGGNSESGSM
ncbi:thioredoxin fold domain-containing protein [bacterium]|nr:thioredoxin fold domain-containing protein [bacterium]